MKRNKVILGLLILTFLIQIWVPANMILEREDIASDGKLFLFKTSPVDPTDYFRGKYVRLDFEEDFFPMDSTSNFKRGQKIFLTMVKDTSGYARISEVLSSPPDGDTDFVNAKVRYSGKREGKHGLFIDLPFDRFYMEETKAPRTESLYRKSNRVKTERTYVEIRVKNGKTVLMDLFVDGERIQDILEKESRETE